MTIYAVGDIQGCFDALNCLLEQVAFNPAKDQLWCAGDLVNRGQKSLQTLRFIKNLGDSARVVLGNHDLHLLAVAYSSAIAKPKDSIDAILDAADASDLLHWLKAQPLIHSDKGYTMVHAGIAPLWTKQQAHSYAAEVTETLRGDNDHNYFASMYGNQPDTWHDNLQGNERLRLITNYFTRMRYSNAQGQLNLSDKQAPAYYPENFAFSPWYEHLHADWKNEKIIFGHWASLQGECPKANVFALDTGCVWGGKLSLLRLGDDKLFQCNCEDPSR